MFAVFVLVGADQWLVAAVVAVVAAVVNWIYFSRRKLPAKYLTPGVIFLVVFQVFVLVYTGYIAFTNYGTGHNGSKEQAVSSLMASALERVEDSPTYPVTVVDQLGTLGLLVTDPDGEALRRHQRRAAQPRSTPRWRAARPSPSTAGRPSASPT